MQEKEFVLDEVTENEAYAEDNRRFFSQTPTLAINIMGAPGSGKTSLLEKLIQELNFRLRAAVIEGDLASVKDAIRISGCNVPVVQINSGRKGNALTAKMINQVLPGFYMDSVDVLFIENVGTPKLPAEKDLGEDLRIFVLSIVGGKEKLETYIDTCRLADIIVLNKVDLSAEMGVDSEVIHARLREINPNAEIFMTCCQHGEMSGVHEISHYIENMARAKGQL